MPQESPFIGVQAQVKSGSVSLGPLSGLREWNFWQRDALRVELGLTPSQAYGRVPWLYRSVNLRSHAVGDVPWKIFKGKTVVLSSEDDEQTPPLELTWVRPPSSGRNIDPTRPTLGELLRLIELDLCLEGKAYWLTDVNRGRIKFYRRAQPSTITPKLDSTHGLNGFERRLPPVIDPTTGAGTAAGNGQPILIKLGDMPFWWLPNPDAEMGPGVSPAMVALRAAGLLEHIDDYGINFFDRGAINTTLLSVEGNPQQAELDRLAAWWKRLVRGSKKAHETVAIRANVKPVVVGSPPKDLTMEQLTAQKRHDISTAMGVPMSILNDESANFATAQQSALNFWQLTVLPECELIETGLNRQVFAPLGYEFRFQPELLDAIQRQRDEKAYEMLAGVLGGGVTPNEFRQQLGLEPLADGDTLREPPQPQVSANQRVGTISSRAASGTAPA